LAASREEATRQARQLRLNTLVVLAGICVIALLVHFLIANHRYRKQLVRLASLDALTGLPNRRNIAEVATGAMHAAKSMRQPMTIAVIDLDHFKAINDSCGHATGDHVLKEFARAGREALREADTLGRWGGEEFLLVMPGATLEIAVANLERLRTLVCGIRLPVSGAGLRVTLSAGLAEYDSDNVRSLDDLIARADSALYEAKNGGRDLIRIADARFITGSHAIRRAQRQ
jgi:diguanylate cyclase (GGDEF)-like protein